MRQVYFELHHKLMKQPFPSSGCGMLYLLLLVVKSANIYCSLDQACPDLTGWCCCGCAAELMVGGGNTDEAWCVFLSFFLSLNNIRSDVCRKICLGNAKSKQLKFKAFTNKKIVNSYSPFIMVTFSK